MKKQIQYILRQDEEGEWYKAFSSETCNGHSYGNSPKNGDVWATFNIDDETGEPYKSTLNCSMYKRKGLRGDEYELTRAPNKAIQIVRELL